MNKYIFALMTWNTLVIIISIIVSFHKLEKLIGDNNKDCTWTRDNTALNDIVFDASCGMSHMFDLIEQESIHNMNFCSNCKGKIKWK